MVYPLPVSHFFVDDDDRSEQDSYEEDSFLEGDDDGYQVRSPLLVKVQVELARFDRLTF